MRVFVSWSGQLSHKYALLLDSWLPAVLQSVQTYVSSSQIESGTRWSAELGKELAANSYGILCLTPHSHVAPWLNFEAGALSKSVEGSHVVPLLFDMKKSDVDYPLAQFQMRLATREDMHALVFDINAATETSIGEQRLNGIFDVWWPTFEEKMKAIQAEQIAEPAAREADAGASAAILEEILEAVRAQQRILSSPESLLPSDYLRHAISHRRVSQALVDIASTVRRVTHTVLRYGPLGAVPVRDLIGPLSDLVQPLEYIGKDTHDIRTAQYLARDARVLRQMRHDIAEADAVAETAAARTTESGGGELPPHDERVFEEEI